MSSEGHFYMVRTMEERDLNSGNARQRFERSDKNRIGEAHVAPSPPLQARKIV